MMNHTHKCFLKEDLEKYLSEIYSYRYRIDFNKLFLFY